MKKNWLPAMLVCAGLALGGCSSSSESSSTASTTSTTSSESTASTSTSTSEGVMTYQEYLDADVDSAVVLEVYVQDVQSWADNKATIYAADPDGGYFIYNAIASEDVYNQLTPGTKIKVSGYKTEWEGEIEVAEGADLEIIGGETYVKPAVDVTQYLGNDAELINYQNQKVLFKDMTVALGDGTTEVYLYNWDGSGQEGDDLYFTVTKDDVPYTFTVESSLSDPNSEVYQTVKNLEVGQTVDLEGYLYWYQGPNPHITSVTVVQ